MKRIHAASPWKILYEKFDPHEEGLREALCVLGNGYFGTRGAAYESVASKIHYPGTYIAGLYNRLATTIAGKTIINEDFVNCPNWLFLTFKIGDGEWVVLSPTRILSYRQELDMHKGVLTRKMRIRNKKGQRTLIESSRIVSMADSHCGAFEYIITPENYSEWVTVRTMLDGTVLNTGVERYRQLNSKHWKPSSLGGLGRNGVYLSMKTTQSKIEASLAARVRLFVADREKRFATRQLMKGKERIGQEFRFFARQGSAYSIEKAVSIYTSKDKNIKSPTTAAIEHAKRPQRFKALLKNHEQEWENLWEKYDIKIEGHNFSQRTLRLHVFHLLQTASIHNIRIDAGIPARGLHGEAYRGHVFWDTMFAMPLYDLHDPQISKSLLLYRYRRLPKAREYANRRGFCGAMFPWQSSSSGREETQVMHLNPLSGKWGPDHSSLQRHVSFAIAYNAWRHWKRTGDFDFLSRYGAEMILSIAQFCSCLARFDPKDGRFHTKGVMGPDEFHEKLPDSPKPGLKDNTYTNLMVVWTLLKAKKILDILAPARKERLLKRLKISHKELGHWEEITRKMKVIINDNAILSQFNGYFGLKELDWEDYQQEYGNIERLDRILKAEGKCPDEYKISKQADALMIFYLLGLSEIKELFHRLGYHFDKKMLRKNYEYYIKRTSHGSTLSKVVYCYIAHLLNRPQEAWRWLFEVLKSDLYDTQGGTTPEGIHVGVMGGSIDIVMRGVAGISFLDDRLRIDPMLPKKWKKVQFKFLYKGRWISMSLTKNQGIIHIEGTKGQAFGLPIEINERLHYLLLDKKYKISLKNKKG